MSVLSYKCQKWEFERRIFISLGIALFVCLLSYATLPASPSSFVLLGQLIGLGRWSNAVGFLLVAMIMLVASALRMWAGALLSSERVMSFCVRNEALITSGPYALVRNPIYLADLLAMVGFALCLRPTGLLLPVLLSLHYRQLTRYEEQSFVDRFGAEYARYRATVPRILPTFVSLVHCARDFQSASINYDGFRNNALYLLFAPGFVLAAFSGQFFHAVLIGLPAVFDWAVIHTKKGKPHDNNRANITTQRQEPHGKKVFSDVLYAQCWEDPHLDRAALRIGTDDIVFSITSGGCNTLTFLLDNPRKVIALDFNPRQNYLLELKMAAFKVLPYEELLEFVGVRASERRLQLYARLRLALSDRARTYWERESRKIGQGIIHCGRYEAYLSLLRRWLGWVIGRATIRRFFEAETPEERAALYRARWTTVWWWLFTRVLLSRRVLTMFFDKAFFQYVDTSFSFGKHFSDKVQHALTKLPMKENYFLSYILLGQYYSEDHLPPYLLRENYAVIRSRLERIEIVHKSCEQYFATLPDDSIAKFNFTNIFEWMSPEAYEELLQETVRVGQDNAVMTYRNLLVARERPGALRRYVYPMTSLAHTLHQRDLSFIYTNYVVEHIRKRALPWHTMSKQSATGQA